MFKNLSRLKNAANLVANNSFHSSIFFGSQVTTTDLRKPFKNVLDSPDLKVLTKNLEQLVLNKPEYREISEKILDCHSDRNKYLFPSDKRQLKRKLNIKLAWIILCLQRLTFACDNDFLSDEVKLNLIKSTLVRRIQNKSLADIENELEILEILNLEESEEDEDVFNELEENCIKDSFLSAYGVEKKDSDLLEYTEDIVRSVGLEIEQKASELRVDFPDIGQHLNELHFEVTTEWLSEYKDRYLDNKYNELDSIWENEDGDPKWVCP